MAVAVPKISSYIAMFLTIDSLSWVYLNRTTVVWAKFTLSASELKEQIYLPEHQIYNHTHE